MFISEEVRKRHEDHNKNLSEIPEVLKRGILLGDYVIVRRKYFTDVKISKNGVIEPGYKALVSDAGNPKASFNDNPFSFVACVLQVGAGDNAKAFSEGDIVWLDYRVMGRGNYSFPLDLENPVSMSEGIEKIPVSAIAYLAEPKVEEVEVEDF